jgi:hypothetical protein
MIIYLAVAVLDQLITQFLINNSFDIVERELLFVVVRIRPLNVAMGNTLTLFSLISHIKQGLLLPLDSFFVVF